MKKSKELNHIICFRADDELYDKMKETAEKADLCMGEYIRRTLDKGKVTVRQEIIADVP